MKTYLTLMASILSFSLNYAQSVEKNADSKFVDFVNSFKESTKSNTIDFRKVINHKAPMSKDEALRFVYHTDDTTKLYCIAFDYSNENEEFRGILGAFPRIPDKCFKINMGDYFIIAYNSYQCTNSCPNPNHAYDCFLNDNQSSFLTLCIVDKGFNLKDSMLVCHENEHEFFITGLLNSQNGKIFLNKFENDNVTAHLYVINKDLKFELTEKKEIQKNVDPDDLMEILVQLEWMDFFQK